MATLCLLWVGIGIAYAVSIRGAATATQQLLAHAAEVRLRLVAERLAVDSSPVVRGQAWDRKVKALATAAGAQVTLLDAQGLVVADSNRSFDRLPNAPASPVPEVQAALERGLGLRFERSTGTLRMHGAVPWRRPQSTQGTIRLILTDTDFATHRDFLDGLSLAAAIGSVLLAFLIALAAAEVSARSVRPFTRVASKMAGGDLSARTGAEGTDELSILGQALDSLAKSQSEIFQELRAEKDRLDRVLSSMTEGVLLVDAEGCVQLVNSALVEMLSLPPNSIGKDLHEVIDHQAVREMLDRASSGEAQTEELNLSKPSVRKIVASARPLPRKGGVLAVLVDNTERHHLENVRQEFVANASHELRTPIAAIISAVETLENIDPASDAAAGFISMISRNAQRLKALVDDLLALSHLESRSVEVDLEPIPLRRIVEAIMNDFSQAARKKNTELVCLVPSDLVVVAAQRGLQHVLGNLVDNAIKYCPEGAKVTVSARRSGDDAAIVVQDDGPGIGLEHRQRIFERFYRVDTGRSRALGGTGLGLSIAKHWVEAMGGSVSVDSDENGTHFDVKLPLQPEPQNEESEERA
jgi:two-component system phosphate regulon sensor histidine kinase PhoR